MTIFGLLTCAFAMLAVFYDWWEWNGYKIKEIVVIKKKRN
jgi:hypothetical protein